MVAIIYFFYIVAYNSNLIDLKVGQKAQAKKEKKKKIEETKRRKEREKKDKKSQFM